jgi:hypothetical protein
MDNGVKIDVARFYFHLRAKVPNDDIEGIELPDVAAARDEALRFGSELMKLNRALGRYGAGGDLVVTNEVGDEVLILSLPAPKGAVSRPSLAREYPGRV